MKCETMSARRNTDWRAIAFTMGVMLVLAHACVSQSLGTPLHGLSAVFSAQTPEAYRERLTGVTERVEEARLKTGTIEDLKKRAREKSEKGDTTEPAEPLADRKRGIRIAADGQLQVVEVRDQPGLPVAPPTKISRALGATKNSEAKDEADPEVMTAMLQGRMQAFELVEVLAYFNPENVNWDGHMGANCDYAGFRQTSLDGLRQLGDIGAATVLQAAGQELAGVTVPREVSASKEGYVSVFNSVYRGQANNPLTRDRKPVDPTGLSAEQIVQQTLLMNPTYHGDLIDLLRYFDTREAISDDAWERLEQLAAGEKDPEIAPFARAVLDLRAMKSDNLEDLLERQTVERVARRLRDRIREGGIADVLMIAEGGKGDLRTQAVKELTERSPLYSEVRDDMPTIVKYAAGPEPELAAAASRQLENAFQRAPMSHCLYWLGKNDDKLSALIWKQVDARIANADAARKAGYADTALKAVQLENLDVPTKKASIELLGRLKNRTVVKPLTELLLDMPRALWPAAGSALRDITGENFGPQAGDGIAEVTVAVKNWREWAEQNIP